MSHTRDIIHDTHASAIEDTRRTLSENNNFGYMEGSEGLSLFLLPADFSSLFQHFIKLDKALKKGKEIGFNFNGNEYTFRYKIIGNVIDGTNIHYKDDSWLRAELSYYKDDGSSGEAGKFINITYTLYMHNKNGPVLSFIGNPTTILNGNNISPVRFEGVSRYQESLMFYQIGFYLLEHMFDFKFSKEIKKIIRVGDFKTPNTQLVMLFGTKDKELDLGLLSSLYCSRLGERKQSKALGEYLGFLTNSVYPGLTGVFMQKKQGNNPYLTINIYDKFQSVKNKKQGKSLTLKEQNLVDSTLRFDITLHAAFLESMIREATTKLSELRKISKKFNKLYGRESRKFVLIDSEGNILKRSRPIVTAYRICRAMQILSLEIKDGVIYNVGFSKWLVNRVLDVEMKLIPILEFNPDRISGKVAIPRDKNKSDRHNSVIDNLNDLIKFWKKYNGEDIIHDYAVYKELKNITVYKYKQQIRKLLKIDITIPYSYWINFDIVNIAYGLSFKEKEQLRDMVRNSEQYDSKKLGDRLKKLSNKNNVVKKQDSQGLLKSIKLVAKKVEAEKFDINLIKEV